MKLTPISIFLLMLFVLVISVVFGNSFQNMEGMTSFHQGHVSATSANVTIPQYNSSSSSVYQMYDNVFFDPNNANLIEVDSAAYQPGNGIDTTGNTIAKIIVVPRTNVKYSYTTYSFNTDTSPKYNNTAESQYKGIISSFISGQYTTSSTNTDKYTIFYIPFSSYTVLHMINLTQKAIVASFMNDTISTYRSTNTQTSLNITAPTGVLNSTKNNQISTLANYDPKRSVCQIVPNIFVDLSNHFLILQDQTGKTLTIYDRDKTVITSNGPIITSSTIKGISYNPWTPWTVVDTAGQQVLVFYTPISQTQTVVAAVQIKSASSAGTDLTLLNACRFDQNGLVTSDGASNKAAPGTSYGPKTGNNYDYHQQFMNNGGYGSGNWNGGMGTGMGCGNLNDYMLKTQIIPPVCPACPACPASGSSSCTNCGGSGTLTAGGNSIVGGATPTDNSAGGVLNNTVNAAGNVANKLIDTTDKLVGDVAVGTGLAVGGVALGTGAVVGSAVDAAGDVAKGVGSVIGGAENAVGNVAAGAENVLGRTITGASNVLANGPNSNGTYYDGGWGNSAGNSSRNTSGNNNRNSYLGTQTQHTDPYSYYGQLPSKGRTNFMPVTADFSSFGK